MVLSEQAWCAPFANLCVRRTFIPVLPRSKLLCFSKRMSLDVTRHLYFTNYLRPGHYARLGGALLQPYRQAPHIQLAQLLYNFLSRGVRVLFAHNSQTTLLVMLN